MKRRLAVVPIDPLRAYAAKGIGPRLEVYYNPAARFDEVFVLSRLERERTRRFGMEVIPTSTEEFASRLRELQIDVVRAYGGYRPADLACLNRVEGVPVIVSVHDTNPDLLHNSILQADYVLPVSGAVRRLLLSRGVPPERLIPFRNRIDLSLFKPRTDGTQREAIRSRFPDRRIIHHIGRKSAQKNLDTLLKALAVLGQEYAGILIGQGDESRYRGLARKVIDILLDAYSSTFAAGDDVSLVIKDFGGDSVYRGQTSRERILDLQKTPGAPEIEYIDGVLTEGELTELYAACSALVHPYRAQGFGPPIAEAMAAGLPVLVTGVGAALDFLNDERAYLIPARMFRLPEKRLDGLETVDFLVVAEPDARALAALLRRVVAEPEEARRKAEAGRTYALEHLNRERTARTVRDRLRVVRSLPVRRISGDEERPGRAVVKENFTSVILCPDGEDTAQAVHHLKEITPGDWELILIGCEKKPAPVEGAQHVAGSFAEAVSVSRGDVVALVRSSVPPGPGWLSRLRRALFARPGYGIAAPLEKDPGADPEVTQKRTLSRASDDIAAYRRIPAREVVVSCLIARREVAEAALEAPAHTAIEIAQNIWTSCAARGLKSVIAGDTVVAPHGRPRRRQSLAALLSAASGEFGKVLLMQQGALKVRELIESGDLEGALEVQRGLIQRCPEERLLLRELGWLLLRAGWPEQTRELLARVLLRSVMIRSG